MLMCYNFPQVVFKISQNRFLSSALELASNGSFFTQKSNSLLTLLVKFYKKTGGLIFSHKDEASEVNKEEFIIAFCLFPRSKQMVILMRHDTAFSHVIFVT